MTMRKLYEYGRVFNEKCCFQTRRFRKRQRQIETEGERDELAWSERTFVIIVENET